jgi:hypothetical protein
LASLDTSNVSNGNTSDGRTSGRCWETHNAIRYLHHVTDEYNSQTELDKRADRVVEVETTIKSLSIETSEKQELLDISYSKEIDGEDKLLSHYLLVALGLPGYTVSTSSSGN